MRYLLCLLLALVASAASGQSAALTNRIPTCRIPPAGGLPPAYAHLARTDKAFKWLKAAGPHEDALNGGGWERVEGAGISDWFDLYRVDLNNDGYCDWYVNMTASVSTGGDRLSLNTLYLGGPKGWQRIGARIPAGKPDALGLGKSVEDQPNYLFGEDVAVVHDGDSNVNYLITAFYNRHELEQARPGYHIYVWSPDRRALNEVDKWEPGSKAEAVYEYFKMCGAYAPGSGNDEDRAEAHFDPAMEAREKREACNPDSAWRMAPRHYGPVSPTLLSRCTHDGPAVPAAEAASATQVHDARCGH